jgi:hypothetical protein
MMPNLHCRGSITAAAVLVALFWSRPAAAQVGPHHGHGGRWNNLVTESYFEILDRAKAERRLEHLEAKLQRDAARGNPAAAERDTRRIAWTRFRISVDEWLIRYNSCQQLGPYPGPLCLDPQSSAAIGQYRPLPFGP